MNNLIKKPYEISLWEDVLIFVQKLENGEIIETEGSMREGIIAEVIAQYYKEKKVCILGSDTMTTPIRAHIPKLVSKINGENILTFDLYSKYYDEIEEVFYDNPFITKIGNEAKIKLRYGALGAPDTKWYDLIIKNIVEDSEKKVYSYTAKDLYINELSKSGFNIVLDAELENNMGTVTKLAEYILAESDWKVGESDRFKQFVEEPMYSMAVGKEIKAYDMETNTSITIKRESESDPMPIIYVFYSVIANQNPYFQFLYEAGGIDANQDNVLLNTHNWYIENTNYTNGEPDFIGGTGLGLTNYRGKRLARNVKNRYDSTTGKYVNIYKDENGDEVYGFTETEYTSPVAVKTIITNPKNFESTLGWEGGGVKKDDVVISPLISAAIITKSDSETTTCIRAKIDQVGQTLYNSGIIDNRASLPNGFIEGEKYVIRWKYLYQSDNNYIYKTSNSSTDFRVCEYTLNNGVYNLGTDYFNFDATENDSWIRDGNYLYRIVSCSTSLSYDKLTKMTNSLGLFFIFGSTGTYNIEEVQFFPYIPNKDEDGNTKPLLPDDIKTGEVLSKYFYYYPDAGYTSIEDVEFSYSDYTPSGSYTLLYNDQIEDGKDNRFEKVRSITASESNRFNLIQDLSEIFECWPKFTIEHEVTGETKMENYSPKKSVSFHEYVTRNNYAGFKYGINLKSIQRTLESDGIISKLIVKSNANEFAQDGSCNIARASENPSGENFIIDFNYYIHKGMINLAALTNDLYLYVNDDKDNDEGYIGYYKRLKLLNDKRDLYIKQQSGLLTDMSNYEAEYQTFDTYTKEKEKALSDKKAWIKSQTGIDYEILLEQEDSQNKSEWLENEEVIAVMEAIKQLEIVSKAYEETRNKAYEKIKQAKEKYELITRILSSTNRAEGQEGEERLLLDKEKLHSAFYKKYSRFLQEGSWISEDYVDDNLYFLDAQSTLHTSSQPKVSYTIKVLEISQLEGYENYSFALGDITTIEDTEFFGWDSTGRPYQEEIVVTEISLMLDSPEENQITVQNYKSQFEDLFQRMAAASQSVEFSTGQYEKVSNIVDEEGNIKIQTLQNSIANNALIISNAKDQTVTWDENGITTIRAGSPEMVRIVNGGIFLTKDGVNWSTGITGNGISAEYITTGSLNTKNVYILNGDKPSFRWDKLGINAYYIREDDNGNVIEYDNSHFVRFDQYGLYGINGSSNFNPQVPDENNKKGEQKIWDNARFALTWQGFMLKSDGDQGYISISSDNDFQVITPGSKEGTEVDRIKIGKLEEGIYGIRIKDAAGSIVMEQDSQGEMWIKNKLTIGEGGEKLPQVTFGLLEMDDEVGQREILHAGTGDNEFIVYEDGIVRARKLYATGGKIGGLDIAELGNEYEVVIEATDGIFFKNEKGTKVLTARLFKSGTEVIDDDLKYQWTKGGVILTNEIAKTLTVSYQDLGSDSATYGCNITIEEESKV